MYFVTMHEPYMAVYLFTLNIVLSSHGILHYHSTVFLKSRSKECHKSQVNGIHCGPPFLHTHSLVRMVSDPGREATFVENCCVSQWLQLYGACKDLHHQRSRPSSHQPGDYGRLVCCSFTGPVVGECGIGM